MKLKEIRRKDGPQAPAAWYVARLYSGEMTGKEEDDLFSWLKAHPAHRRAYSEALALWDAAGELRENPELIAVGEAQHTPGGAWRSRSRWIAAAAAVTVVALSPFFASFLDGWGDGQTLASYETAIGEQRIVTLEDGSRLTLNTSSRVLVDYRPLERRIIMDFGEVFFEIEKDTRRPLTVSARGRMVTVLGTKFSVLLTGNDVRVAVVEGAVAVSMEQARLPLAKRQARPAPPVSDSSAPSAFEELVGPDDLVLRAGAIATFGDGYEQLVHEETSTIEQMQSWREGLVRFDSERLYKVVAELNRYSQVKILIEDDTIVNLPISGVFGLERVDLILDALDDVIPVTVVRYPDRYVVKSSIRRQDQARADSH